MAFPSRWMRSSWRRTSTADRQTWEDTNPQSSNFTVTVSDRCNCIALSSFKTPLAQEHWRLVIGFLRSSKEKKKKGGCDVTCEDLDWPWTCWTEWNRRAKATSSLRPAQPLGSPLCPTVRQQAVSHGHNSTAVCRLHSGPANQFVSASLCMSRLLQNIKESAWLSVFKNRSELLFHHKIILHSKTVRDLKWWTYSFWFGCLYAFVYCCLFSCASIWCAFVCKYLMYKYLWIWGIWWRFRSGW